MAARALVLFAAFRCLAVGLMALAVGVLAFPVVAVLAMATPAVSGAWLTLPCLLAVVGTGAVMAWLVFGGGATRVNSTPAAAQQWPWHPAEQ